MNRANLWIVLILFLAIGSGVLYFLSAKKDLDEKEITRTPPPEVIQEKEALEEANQMLEMQLKKMSLRPRSGLKI